MNGTGNTLHFLVGKSLGRDMRILHDIMMQETSLGPRLSLKMSIANESTVFMAMIRWNHLKTYSADFGISLRLCLLFGATSADIGRFWAEFVIIISFGLHFDPKSTGYEIRLSLGLHFGPKSTGYEIRLSLGVLFGPISAEIRSG